MVDVSAVQQLQSLVIVEGLVEAFGDGLELFKLNESVLILVKDSEDSLESVLGFGFSDLVSDDIQELLKVDGFVLIFEVVNQTQNEGVSFVESQLFEGLGDFSWVNGAAMILIKHLESILEVFIVLGGESVFPGSWGGFGGGRFCGARCWSLSVGSAHNI